MHPASLLTDWIMGRLEARAAAIAALSNESFALVREDSLGLDAVDHEVLRVQLATANKLFLVLVCSFGDDPDTDVLVEHARIAAGRHRPRIDPDDDRRRYLVTLMSGALERALQLRRLFARLRTGEKLVASLGRAALHLEMGLLVLGAERIVEPRSARQRVQLASQREQLELTVEEYRDLVRGYREGPDATTAGV